MIYAPKTPPTISNIEELRQYVDDELRNVALEFSKTNLLWLNPLAREPDKPREGMVAYADGTNWDPSDGEGSYEYDGAGWVKLGNEEPPLEQIGGAFWVNRNGSNQTGLSGATLNVIQFNNEVYDVDGYFNTSNFRYLPTVAGLYHIGLAVSAVYTSTTDAVQAIINKNGSTFFVGTYIAASSASSWSSVSGLVDLNGSTDYVEGAAYVPASPTHISGSIQATYMFGYRVKRL